MIWWTLTPTNIIVDGNRRWKDVKYECIEKTDSLYPCVSAACGVTLNRRWSKSMTFDRTRGTSRRGTLQEEAHVSTLCGFFQC